MHGTGECKKNEAQKPNVKVLPWLEHGFQEHSFKILSDNHYTIAPRSSALLRSMLRTSRLEIFKSRDFDSNEGSPNLT